MTFPLYFYLSLLIISPWPLFYSFMFYHTCVYDKTFNFHIWNKDQRRSCWTYILVLPVFCSYIFWLRYKRIGKSLNLWEIGEKGLAWISALSWFDIFFILIFILIFIIFWALLFRCIYQHYRKCALALYLYYHQYKRIEEIYHAIFNFWADYQMYLVRRIKIFTKSLTATFGIGFFIWPICTDILERNLYFFIIPYLIIFDFIIQQGELTKIFFVLPWYYIYSLLRFALKFFFAIHEPYNWRSSREMYGYPR